MNPFDLRGPQYLAFYVVLVIAMLFIVWMMRRWRELREEGNYGSPITDPYMIAYLRGGEHELVRVALVSLVDRGLLAVRQDTVQPTVQITAVGQATLARKPIERELLQLCTSPVKTQELFRPLYPEVVSSLEAELLRMRLLPDGAIEAFRRTLYAAGAAVLLFFAVTKIVVALSRGRGNVVFLILLCVLALGLLKLPIFTRRTAKGDAFLSELENLFRSLKLRARQIQPGGATTELAMLAAVWGVTALPYDRFGWSYRLMPPPPPQPSSAVGSSCGSSGSSCGSSSGSSCGGGGGCGGGCGGCGG